MSTVFMAYQLSWNHKFGCRCLTSLINTGLRSVCYAVLIIFRKKYENVYTFLHRHPLTWFLKNCLLSLRHRNALTKRVLKIHMPLLYTPLLLNTRLRCTKMFFLCIIAAIETVWLDQILIKFEGFQKFTSGIHIKSTILKYFRGIFNTTQEVQ